MSPSFLKVSLLALGIISLNIIAINCNSNDVSNSDSQILASEVTEISPSVEPAELSPKNTKTIETVSIEETESATGATKETPISATLEKIQGERRLAVQAPADNSSSSSSASSPSVVSAGASTTSTAAPEAEAEEEEEQGQGGAVTTTSSTEAPSTNASVDNPSYDMNALPADISIKFDITEKMATDEQCLTMGLHYYDGKYLQTCSKASGARAKQTLRGGSSPMSATPERSYFQMKDMSNTTVKQATAADAETVFNGVTVYDDKVIVSVVDKESLLSYQLETLEKTEDVMTFPYKPASITFDKAMMKVYATDGETNKIHVHDMNTTDLTEADPIEVFCGQSGVATTGLSQSKYVKPYLYVHIKDTGYIVRINIEEKKCDAQFLLNLSVLKDTESPLSTSVAFDETDFIFSGIMADEAVTEYTGSAFPDLFIGGKSWKNIYRLSNGTAMQILQALSIFALAAFVQVY